MRKSLVKIRIPEPLKYKQYGNRLACSHRIGLVLCQYGLTVLWVQFPGPHFCFDFQQSFVAVDLGFVLLLFPTYKK